MKDKAGVKILAIVLTSLFVVFPFLSLFLTGILLPPQYADTYYGQLAVMVQKLKQTEGKKLVVVGNSAVAFGVDSALFEKLLYEGGLEYSVVNFGLYGALGTKMMMDIAEEYIGEGDIVLLSPEFNAQSLSTYFSAEHAWYALDSDASIFHLLDDASRKALVGNYAAYVSLKYRQKQSGAVAQGSGVYAKSSFDENGDLKNFDRTHNVLSKGVDENNMIALEGTMYASTFVEYANDYAERIQKQGGKLYYTFAPINALSLLVREEDALEFFYESVEQMFAFPILNDFSDCILESGWFYDSNVHLNEAGMALHTVNLVNEVKNALGNTTKTEYVLPEMPTVPQPDLEGEGDNSCRDMFTYQRVGNYYTLTGLTALGKEAKTLILPYQVDGIYINGFTPKTFEGGSMVETIVVQDNISNLSDGSFSGCKQLKKLVLKHTSPTGIAVGYHLLDGVSENCKIYVPKEAVSAFKNNYFWSRYAKRIQAE